MTFPTFFFRIVYAYKPKCAILVISYDENTLLPHIFHVTFMSEAIANRTFCGLLFSELCSFCHFYKMDKFSKGKTNGCPVNRLFTMGLLAVSQINALFTLTHKNKTCISFFICVFCYLDCCYSCRDRLTYIHNCSILYQCRIIIQVIVKQEIECAPLNVLPVVWIFGLNDFLEHQIVSNFQ